MIRSLARRWANGSLREENQTLRDRNRDLRLQLRRWEKAHREAERYFDAVNEPDELWAFDPKYEARAVGAAGYRLRIQRALPDAREEKT